MMLFGVVDVLVDGAVVDGGVVDGGVVDGFVVDGFVSWTLMHTTF